MNEELLKIRWSYSYMPDESFARLTEIVGYDLEHTRNDAGILLDWKHNIMELTLEEALSVGADFTVTGRTGYVRRSSLDTYIQAQMTKVPDPPLNHRCNVMVGGAATMCITEVEVLEDTCTDYLQKRLCEGWRILAVCVQPDSRRPDYVIGK